MKQVFARALTLGTLVAGLTYAPVSHAIVDMKNAAYSEQFLDIIVPGLGFDLKVLRIYNSRFNFSGIFGYGWCSDFETALERTPEGGLKLQECGAGQETTYSTGKADPKSVQTTVDTIMAAVKKANPTATATYMENLRTQLMTNTADRVTMAKRLKIPIPDTKKGSVYTADNLSVDQITWDGTVYTRVLSDGTSQKFDDRGRLLYLYDKNNNYIKLGYANDTLKEVVDNNGRKLTFTYDNKRVKGITGPNVNNEEIKAEYKFKGEDLAEVKNMWHNTYGYEYKDNDHNLTKIAFPDNTFKALTYDKVKDWVTSFTDRASNGVACTETYNYEEDKAAPRDHFWSTAVKKCGKDIKNQARFEFWHKRKADGSRFLSRVLTKTQNDSTDVTYHPEFGRPTAITKNGITTSYTYFDSGLVKTKSSDSARLVYEYKNEYNKVSKVVTEYYDAKGKKIRERDATFQYDKRGNLSFAQNSDGQTVHLTYENGRIASIVDQAKKEVLIKYNEKIGKPSAITRPKMGTVTFTYKPNGEVDKVESKDGGPTVALQIAQTFNNLLDVIAPATSELGL